MDNQNLWQGVLNEIELSLTRANFNTWFKNTEVVSFTESKVVIRVPNDFSRAWLQDKYEAEIKKSLIKTIPGLQLIEYVVGVKHPTETIFKDAPISKAISRPTAPVMVAQTTRVKGETAERLNPRYTFDTFVVGESNRLAQATAEAVAKAPGITYNPLFIYGGVGLGKTHLMQAIGNEILASYPKKKVVYVTSERFTNELVNAIQKKSTREFKEKYRKVDCLIIDDVQFLAGKEATQEEFFHTFNALHENNKQIIIASDRPPKAIPTLEARLRSRFEWGMTADISPPNYEMRLAVLKAKAANVDLQLPDEALEHIATRIQNNIRELEGALTRVVAFGQLNNTVPTVEEVESLLGGILVNPGKRTLKAGEVIKTVAKHYEIKKDEILGRRRNKEIIVPRQVAVFLLREEMDLSYKAIGRELGGRDHTTIIHDYRRIKDLIMENTNLENDILEIKNKLYSVD